MFEAFFVFVNCIPRLDIESRSSCECKKCEKMVCCDNVGPKNIMKVIQVFYPKFFEIFIWIN